MSRSQSIIAVLAACTCILFVVRFAIGPKPTEKPSRDVSGLERAAASGAVEAFGEMGTAMSVWAPDFEAIEPALQDAAGDDEIKLMRGNAQVGVYTRRAGIQLRGK